MSKILVILVLSFLSFRSYSQTADTIYIIPENPTINDDIILVAHVSSTCPILEDTNIEISNNIILVDGKYYQCPSQAVTIEIDTFLIGNLKTGSYELIFRDSIFGGSEFLSTDLDTVYFYVNELNTIDKNIRDKSISFYPNPFNEKLTMKWGITQSWSVTETKSFTVKIFNLIGTEVYNIEILRSSLTLNDGVVIDGSGLQKGVYIVDVGGYRKKIIKN